MEIFNFCPDTTVPFARGAKGSRLIQSFLFFEEQTSNKKFCQDNVLLSPYLPHTTQPATRNPQPVSRNPSSRQTLHDLPICQVNHSFMLAYDLRIMGCDNDGATMVLMQIL